MAKLRGKSQQCRRHRRNRHGGPGVIGIGFTVFCYRGRRGPRAHIDAEPAYGAAGRFAARADFVMRSRYFGRKPPHGLPFAAASAQSIEAGYQSGALTQGREI
jgi:hypothetical protein